MDRMGMMLCSATQAETIEAMLLLRLAKRHGHKNYFGKFYPKFTPAMDKDGEAETFKGLHKKLSHLFHPFDLSRWVRDEYVWKFMSEMPKSAPVMLRFPLNDRGFPRPLTEGPTRDTIFTDYVQGMVASEGPLYYLLVSARGRSVYLVGTSANFAGEPTIVSAKELRSFADSLTGVKKIYLDYGNPKEARQRQGVDSLSILQPTSANQAIVLRQAKDFAETRTKFAQEGFILTVSDQTVSTTQ